MAPSNVRIDSAAIARAFQGEYGDSLSLLGIPYTCSCAVYGHIVVFLLVLIPVTRVVICYLQVVKVAGVSLWALFREKKEKPRN